jgi:hypothetical protein
LAKNVRSSALAASLIITASALLLSGCGLSPEDSFKLDSKSASKLLLHLGDVGESRFAEASSSNSDYKYKLPECQEGLAFQQRLNNAQIVGASYLGAEFEDGATEIRSLVFDLGKTETATPLIEKFNSFTNNPSCTRWGFQGAFEPSLPVKDIFDTESDGRITTWTNGQSSYDYLQVLTATRGRYLLLVTLDNKGTGYQTKTQTLSYLETALRKFVDGVGVTK